MIFIWNFTNYCGVIPTFYAHKKGGGSSGNGRDSKGRRLGLKVGDGQLITPGTIIYRQRGTKIHPGLNVRRGRDDTLYSITTGFVRFEKKTRARRVYAHVYPPKAA